MSEPRLEVIVCSLSDALAAERGGAHRLEIISHFELGGLTPEVSLVREIAAQVSIPLRVMIRSRPDFAAPGGVEWQRLLDQAKEIAALQVEGFVLGFVEDGQVNDDALAEVLACGPQARATFHRAFEKVTSISDAVGALKKHRQVDRILHSGGAGDATVRAERLSAIARLAAPEVSVIAGGGLDQGSIEIIRAQTTLNEFHVGRGARTPSDIDGAVDPRKVRDLVELIRGPK